MRAGKPAPRMRGENEMKKLFSMYKSYMFRPILYKTITRASVIAVLCLLWEQFLSDGHFSLWQAPGFFCGALMLGWAWMDYLQLDGIRLPFFPDRFKAEDKKKKRHATRSIVDYADEKIVSFEELEPLERVFCSMISCLILGVPLVAAGLLL